MSYELEIIIWPLPRLARMCCERGSVIVVLPASFLNLVGPRRRQEAELTHDDHIVVEANGNAAVVVEVLAPYVDRVVIAKPKKGDVN